MRLKKYRPFVNRFVCTNKYTAKCRPSWGSIHLREGRPRVHLVEFELRVGPEVQQVALVVVVDGVDVIARPGLILPQPAVLVPAAAVRLISGT